MERLFNDLGGTEPVYRVYLIGEDDHIRSVASVTALDDETAIQATRDLVDGHAIELWDRGRKIIRFEAEPAETIRTD